MIADIFATSERKISGGGNDSRIGNIPDSGARLSPLSRRVAVTGRTPAVLLSGRPAPSVEEQRRISASRRPLERCGFFYGS